MAEPVRSLLMGPVYTIGSTLHVAMPARTVKIWSSTSLISANTIVSTTGEVALTFSGGQAESSAPFIRTTAASASIRILPL